MSDSGIELMVARLLDELEASEFSCSMYATKEQPHVEGLRRLWHTAYVVLKKISRRNMSRGMAWGAGGKASRVLHRILSFTIRRMHMGVLDMLSFLRGDSYWCCSRSSENLYYEATIRQLCLLFAASCRQAAAPTQT